jgi:hypothetical protein
MNQNMTFEKPEKGRAGGIEIWGNHSFCVTFHIVSFHGHVTQFSLKGEAIEHLRKNTTEESPSGAFGTLMLKMV